MKKIYFATLFCALLLSGIMLSASPMAVYNKKCDWYDVKTQYYRCTFYNGCMYPVWFTSADGKVEFPRGFMLDWIKKADAPDTELHYLRYDQHAEVKVIENSNDTLIVECTGKFCKGLYRFPGVTAVYRWTLQKNSPVITLQGTISFDKNAPRQLCLTMFGSMAFENTPFEKVQVGQASPQKFRTVETKAQSFVARDGIMLIMNNNMVFGVNGPAVAFNNNLHRFYTYVSKDVASQDRRWNGLQPLKFEMQFKVAGRPTQAARD